MKKIILLAVAALVLMAAVAQADMIINLTELNDGSTGIFGTVTVHLIDSQHATVTFSSSYTMFDSGMVDLSVNSTNFTASFPSDPNHPGYPKQGSGTVSAFGDFNFTLQNFDGPTNGFLTYTITLTDISGSWANASDVLLANDKGHEAAIHILYSDGNSYYASDGPQKVPEPSTFMLLGTGLLGLAFLGRKKFMNIK